MTPSSRLLGALLALATLSSAHARDDAADTDALESLLARPVWGAHRLGAASKHGEDLDTAPGAVVVRTGGEIRAQGWRTLGEVLESMPGVHLRYDRTYTYASMRGATRPGDYTSHLLVLLDGVRVNDALYESAPMDRDFPLDVALIDRVEFIPGPGSALYGSSAMAGVVNVVTRQPSQLPGARLGVAIGEQRARRASATWGGSVGGARVLFGWAAERRPGGDLRYAAYDSPSTNGGVARGRDGERSDKLYLKLQADALRLTAALSPRRKEVPTGAYDAAFDTPVPWTDTFALFNASWSRALGPDALLELTLGHARYGFLSTGRYGDDGALSSRAQNDGRWWNGEARLHWSGWAGHRLTVGWEGQSDYREHIGVLRRTGDQVTANDFDGRASRVGVYLNDEWSLLPSLTLVGGLRHDRRTDGSAGFSPRAAAIWQAAPSLVLKWIGGSAYREANFSELEYEDAAQVRPGRLRVESLRSHELVARWQPAPAWSLQASAYHARMRDVIEMTERDDGMLVYANRGGVRTRGVSAELTHTSAGGLQWRAGWSFDDARDAGTDRVMTNAPRGLLKLAVTTPLGPPGLLLGANAVAIGHRTTLAGDTIGTTVRLNARLGYAPPGARWSIALSVANLLDRASSDPAGPEHRQDTIAQDGRRAMLSLEWQL